MPSLTLEHSMEELHHFRSLIYCKPLVESTLNPKHKVVQDFLHPEKQGPKDSGLKELETCLVEASSKAGSMVRGGV